MMGTLSELEAIQQIKNLKSQREIQDISLQESNLRQQIATLSGHRSECHALKSDGHVMRSIGGDILWLAWIDRRQAELTLELAKLLARKETVKMKSRKDAGRHSNIQEMAETERDRVNKLRSASALEQTVALSQITSTDRQR